MSLLDLGKGYWIKLVRPRKRLYTHPRAEEVKYHDFFQSCAKQSYRTLEEMEKLLLIGINEKQISGDRVSEAVICE